VVNPLVPVLLLAALPQATHPLHSTFTTIAWGSRTQTLQVAVRVFTQDLYGRLSPRNVRLPGFGRLSIRALGAHAAGPDGTIARDREVYDRAHR
jgi:hypothetical protein